MATPKFRSETANSLRMRSNLMTVRLSPAREPKRPDGSSVHGYAFVVPLDQAGRLDAGLWARRRDECRVTRFSPDGPAALGMLAHRRGGAGGATWGFEFDAPAAEQIDLGFRLDLHRFHSGDYVTVSHLGKNHTYRVDAIRPYAPEKRMDPLSAPCPTAAALRAALDRAVA